MPHEYAGMSPSQSMEYMGDRYALDNQYKVSQAMMQAQMNQKPYEWRARKGSQIAPVPPSGMSQIGGMLGLGALSAFQGQAQRDLLKKYQTPAPAPPGVIPGTLPAVDEV